MVYRLVEVEQHCKLKAGQPQSQLPYWLPRVAQPVKDTLILELHIVLNLQKILTQSQLETFQLMGQLWLA